MDKPTSLEHKLGDLDRRLSVPCVMAQWGCGFEQKRAAISVAWLLEQREELQKKIARLGSVRTDKGESAHDNH